MRARLGLAILALGFAAGCSSDQPWTFRNGIEITPDEEPTTILAEVYRGGECGFACQPPGELVYCASVPAGDRGPAPEGLDEGERYCFVGTAFDAAGQTFGVGCEVATVGGGPITVTFGPSDEVRQRECAPGVADAGMMPRDAGVPVDAGPPPSTVVLTVESAGRGGFFVQNQRTGRGWIVPSQGAGSVRFNLRVDFGNVYEVHPRPDPGYRFDIYEGGGCDVFIPCEIQVTADTTIRVIYLPS